VASIDENDTAGASLWFAGGVSVDSDDDHGLAAAPPFQDPS
jgi:hypothetical protein